MKIITKQIKAYEYGELSDNAKYAVASWLNAFDDNVEFVLEDFTAIADMLGFYDIDIRYSGFCSQGDGASFTGNYKWCDTQALKKFAPIDTVLHNIADQLQAMPDTLRADITDSGIRYSHSNSVNIQAYMNDDDIDKSIADQFDNAARALMDWLYSTLEKEYDCSRSDKRCSEICADNGYMFDANGKPVH